MSYNVVSLNEGTTKAMRTDLVGTVHYGVTKLDIGDVGAVSLFTGTIPEVAQVANGTIRVTAGTVTKVAMLNAGTIDTITSVTEIVNGSIKVTSGTVTVGSVANIGMISAGTITTLPTLNLASGSIAVIAGTSVVTGGSIVVTAGTIASLPTLNITSGSLVVTTGTINSGTINAGTVTTFAGVNALNFATVINVGTSVYGTIKAGVSGTTYFITDLAISVGSASNVCIYDGGTANPIFGTLTLAANGGVVENFRQPLPFSAGTAITYQQSANGPLMIFVRGYATV